MVEPAFALHTLLYVASIGIGGRIVWTSVKAYSQTRSSYVFYTSLGFTSFTVGALCTYLTYLFDEIMVTVETVAGLTFFAGFTAFWLSFQA